MLAFFPEITAQVLAICLEITAQVLTFFAEITAYLLAFFPEITAQVLAFWLEISAEPCACCFEISAQLLTYCLEISAQLLAFWHEITALAYCPKFSFRRKSTFISVTIWPPIMSHIFGFKSPNYAMRTFVSKLRYMSLKIAAIAPGKHSDKLPKPSVAILKQHVSFRHGL